LYFEVEEVWSVVGVVEMEEGPENKMKVWCYEGRGTFCCKRLEPEVVPTLIPGTEALSIEDINFLSSSSASGLLECDGGLIEGGKVTEESLMRLDMLESPEGVNDVPF
jgi:hypothetical protein